MKKVILLLMIAAMAFSFAACGPDYTEEFNAAVEAYDEKVDEYDEAAEEFADGFEDAETEEEVRTLCQDMASLSEEMLVDFEDLLEEIESYEEGISDEEAFETTVENMGKTIEVVKIDIKDIPTMEDFFVLSYEFVDLATEWEIEAMQASDALVTMTTVEEINDGLDAIIAVNDKYIEKMVEVQTKLEALELDEYQGDIDEVVEGIKLTIEVIDQVSVQMDTLKQ